MKHKLSAVSYQLTGILLEGASGVEWASGVELASCQFHAYFRAGRMPTLLLFIRRFSPSYPTAGGQKPFGACNNYR
ncbi:MAG: hypothetical protein F6K10_39160 [Moorea sp. SIO2B7]|nr:hypothetical protein [Moorena sp. SIO2B7]